MEVTNKNSVGNNMEKGEEVEVYEGEIIDNYQEKTTKTAIEKKENKSPTQRFAYKLGAFAGSLLPLLGLIGEIGHRFKSGKSGVAGMNKRGGRHRRRRNRTGS